MDNIILGSEKRTTQFPLHIDKNEIKTIQNQGALFLKKAYELSKGSPTQPVSAFKIMDILGYDKKTLERIYFYLEDQGLIKTFALGGEFTITQKGTERQADPKH